MSDEIQITMNALHLLRWALVDARELGYELPGPGHVVMAISHPASRVPSIANLILREIGIDGEQLRSAIRNAYNDPASRLVPEGGLAELIEAAERSAQGFQHAFVGTEHILFGALRVGGPVLRRALEQQNISMEEASARSETWLHESIERGNRFRRQAQDAPASAERKAQDRAEDSGRTTLFSRVLPMLEGARPECRNPYQTPIFAYGRLWQRAQKPPSPPLLLCAAVLETIVSLPVFMASGIFREESWVSHGALATGSIMLLCAAMHFGMAFWALAREGWTTTSSRRV